MASYPSYRKEFAPYNSTPYARVLVVHLLGSVGRFSVVFFLPRITQSEEVPVPRATGREGNRDMSPSAFVLDSWPAEERDVARGESIPLR